MPMRNPDHEDRVREVLVEAGVRYLSLSHELSDSVRLLPRVETAVANAYLEPVMERFHLEGYGSFSGRGVGVDDERGIFEACWNVSTD